MHDKLSDDIKKKLALQLTIELHDPKEKVFHKGLVIKYRGGGGPAEIGGGSSIFKLTKRGGSPKYWSCL